MTWRFLSALLGGNSLRARALRGTALTFAGFGGAMLLRLGSNIILTRLLAPEIFGLMALVQLMLVAVEMFSDLGVNVSIIQNRRGEDPRFLNTAWTLQILRGALLWAIIAALAPLVASFYGQPELAQLLPVVGVTALLMGMQSTKLATSNRNLTLGRLTTIELGSQATGILAMILLALWMESVWALVIGGLIGTVVRLAASHLALPGPVNRLDWEGAAFLELFHFGKYIFLSSCLGFLINHGDRAILGKFISLYELGIYNIGYSLAAVPVMLSRQLGPRVLLPIYRAAPPGEGAANRLKLRKARGLLAGTLITGCLMLGAIGEWLVALLYDDRYLHAGPLLVLLVLSSIPSITIMAYSTLYLAEGKSRDFTILLGLMALAQTTALYFGVRELGLMGAVVAPLAAAAVSYPLTAYYARRHGGWDPALDAGLLAFGLAGSLAVLWLHDDAVTRVLAGF